jgi:hypothetical protein
MAKSKPFKALFTYPLTYAVIILIICAHTAFTLWFMPSVFMHGLVLIADVILFSLWFFLSIKSGAFKEHLNKMPYEEQISELKEILKECPQDYRKIAGACIELIQKVKADFKDQRYSYEMDYMVSNIINLSENHKQLYKRYLDFGNQEQKQNMKNILDSQMKSIANTLNTLKTFSGNLTLLDANAEKSAEAAGELKEINKSLKEVIEELDYV